MLPGINLFDILTLLVKKVLFYNYTNSKKEFEVKWIAPIGKVSSDGESVTAQIIW